MDDPKDEHESFKDSGVGIGANAEGQVEVFPLSELPARIAARNEQERAWDDAMKSPEDRAFEEEYLANLENAGDDPAEAGA